MKPIPWKWAVAALAVLLIGAGIAYADLLRAAFQRNPVPRSAASIARGRALFEADCAVCHGPQGHGDGVAAAAMPSKPDDLGRLAPPPIFPDGVVAYRIRHGVGLMPAFDQALSDEQLWDLLNYIRALAPAKK
ncbi:MAG TPA: cytochrome c [Burkholderiales bacterium]|nr:cytochrome c [Burkholderiales bacterium]